MTIITKDKFIPLFLRWVKRKCEESLPEEDFEMSMFLQAMENISKHSGRLPASIKYPRGDKT